MLWQTELVTIFNALIVAVFLILLAASVAVVGSMILLALFDAAFAKKSAKPSPNDATEFETSAFDDEDQTASTAETGAAKSASMAA
jgi:hypothetical protein